METFLVGLTGALIGGSCLAATFMVLFYYEKKQAKKVADKMVNDFKDMYYNKLANEVKKDDGSRFN